MVNDTKTQIMDVAETLFAEYGYDGTSLRMITQSAGVNLASVNYHFGGKDALLEAVYARRINPMNKKRLSCLDDLKQRNEDSKIAVSLLVDAYVRPALELSRGDGKPFIALLGRSYLEPTAVIQEKVSRMFDEVAERFREEFEKALPEIPARELYWRLHFMVGVLAYCMAGTDMMRMIASSHIAEKNSPERLIDRLVRFICNGMEAPVGEQPVSA